MSLKEENVCLSNSNDKKSKLLISINQNLKEAMKAKDSVKRDALRLLTAAFKQVEVDTRKELLDEDIVKIIKKQVKTRNDSITQFKKASRQDLIDIEEKEISIYSIYLPEAMSDEDMEVEIKNIISKVNATSMKDMGKVMGMSSSIEGIDMSKAKNIVQKLLS